MERLRKTFVVSVILSIYLLVSCYFGGIYSSIIPFNHSLSTNRAFSYDITSAIQTSPMGVELFSYVNAFFFPKNLLRSSPSK